MQINFIVAQAILRYNLELKQSLLRTLQKKRTPTVLLQSTSDAHMQFSRVEAAPERRPFGTSSEQRSVHLNTSVA